MARSVVQGVRIAGLSGAVPTAQRTVADLARLFGEDDAAKISKSVGVTQRRVTTDDLCTSDLCERAANDLLAALEWERDTVDLLVFVSQTPDYILPATSCVLQARLALSKHCAAFDINLGCSGYVYGLAVASQLMAGGGFRRALLLVGDTISKIASPEDRSVEPLFGDAGTCTALEVSGTAEKMVFEFGTDGRGEQNLIVPAGGFRRRRTSGTSLRSAREGGNVRSDEDLFMNGPEIFAFTNREVRPMIENVLRSSAWSLEDPDFVVMHQANLFMLQHLAKKLKLPEEKTVYALETFGNTSSASIPIAIIDRLQEALKGGPRKLLLAGFGVGYSWAACTLQVDDPLVLPLAAVTAPVERMAQ